MDTANILTLIGFCLPVLGGLGVLIYKSGILSNRVVRIEEDVKDIKTDVISLNKQTAEWGVKLDTLWERGFTTSKSPRVLNEVGEKILANSGIKDIVDDRYEKILTEVKGMNPPNAYQAESCVIRVINNFGQEEDLIPTLQDGAFKAGVDVVSLLLVGAIYIRDKILAVLGYDISQINSNQPKKATA